MDQPIRILVCDDSRLLRRLLAKMIETDPAFHLVREVGTGEDCLALLPSIQPDVVVMDIALPKMSGIECMNQARVRGSDAEFLILSASAQPESPTTLAAMEAGAFTCIPKADGLMAMDQIQARTLEALRAAGAKALARPGRPTFPAPVRTGVKAAGPAPAQGPAPIAAPAPAPLAVAAPGAAATPPPDAPPAPSLSTGQAPPAAPMRFACANCEKPVDAADAFPCPMCRRPHHKPCWDFNRGCGFPGCRGGKLEGTLKAVYEEQERDQGVKRRLLRIGGVLALIAAAWFGYLTYRGYSVVQKLKHVVNIDALASASPSASPAR